MAFFERVCGYNDNGTFYNSDFGGPNLNLPMDVIVSAVGLVVVGLATREQVIASLGLRPTVDASGRSDIQDFDLWFNARPAANQEAKQALYIQRFHDAVYIQNSTPPRGNYPWPGLTTPNDVRAALGVSMVTYTP